MKNQKMNINMKNTNNGKRIDEHETTNTGVSVLHDHIYFYAPITQESAMELNRILQDLSMKLAPTAFTSMQEVGSPSPIWLIPTVAKYFLLLRWPIQLKEFLK